MIRDIAVVSEGRIEQNPTGDYSPGYLVRCTEVGYSRAAWLMFLWAIRFQRRDDAQLTTALLLRLF